MARCARRGVGVWLLRPCFEEREVSVAQLLKRRESRLQ